MVVYMSIKTTDSTRILCKVDGSEVNIKDGEVIQYTGVYYKTINDIVERVNIESTFIGTVECCRYRHDKGIEGIYVKPLYIWDKVKNEWKRLNVNPPQTKYFFYPHLLMLPEYNDCPSCYYPLYMLHTCENKRLREFLHIKKTFDLFDR